MLSAFEVEQRLDQRARVLKAEALTPQHSAAEAATDAQAVADAERRRRRVQHEVDPYPDDTAEAVEAVEPDLDKRYRQAQDTPTGYPPLGPVSPEVFRRGPVTADHAAYSAGYDSTARPVPVPSATLSPEMITRPLMTDGRSRPSAPGGC
jgi:hypothetical protein